MVRTVSLSLFRSPAKTTLKWDTRPWDYGYIMADYEVAAPKRDLEAQLARGALTEDAILDYLDHKGAERLEIIDNSRDYHLRRPLKGGVVAGFDGEVAIGPGGDGYFLWAPEEYPGDISLFAGFYRRCRQKMDFMLTSSGTPWGGKWSYDAEFRNRAPPPEELDSVLPARGSLASPGIRGLAFPGARSKALSWWRRFRDDILGGEGGFGKYEDSIVLQPRGPRQVLLWHSGLSSSINGGLIEVAEIVGALRDMAPGKEIEAYFRQLMWREFMAFIYWKRSGEPSHILDTGAKDPRRGLNFFEGRGLAWPQGEGYMASVLARAQELGYLHHIERLMVVGSYFLTGRSDPKRVESWFIANFLDSGSGPWVMFGNCYLMSQCADGLKLAHFTRPYLGSANYIKGMTGKGDRMDKASEEEITGQYREFKAWVARHRPSFYGRAFRGQ